MTHQNYILADIGGTNARFAYGSAQGVDLQSTKHYRNDDFADFNGALRAFLADHPAQNLAGGCFAIAGPVSGETAKLTNRPWDFDRDQIARLTGVKNIALVNDMTALGHATRHLSSAQTAVWHRVENIRPNGQSLVLGLGTGVNISATVGQSVLAAEVGHSGLTATMADLLRHKNGPAPTADCTTEDYLSGRGIEKIYRHFAGTSLSGAEICAAACTGQNAQARATTDLYAMLVSQLLRQLTVHYLPLNGIYLSGSVARGIFDTPSKDLAIADLSAPNNQFHSSVSLITDDAAALYGCLHIATQA